MLAEFEDGSGTTPQHALREALRAALDESPHLKLVPDAVIEGVRHGRSASTAADDLRQLCQSVHARAKASRAPPVERGFCAALLCAVTVR